MEKQSLVRTLLVIAAAPLVATLILTRSDQDSLARILETGRIDIGYAIEPPYAFVSADGEVTGESPEVARHILSRLGIEDIRWHQMEFQDLIPALQARRIHVIAAGLFVTESRARQVLFSDTTFQVAPALLVAKNNDVAPRSYRELGEHPDLKVAVLAGSVEEQLLAEIPVAPSRQLRVPDAQTGYASVVSGLADAMLLSAPSLRWCIKQDICPNSTMIRATAPDQVSKNLDYGRGAFAFRLSDQRLVDTWNRAASQYLGSPEHRALLISLGFLVSEAPSSPDKEFAPHD